MASGSERLEFKGILEEWWETWRQERADQEALWLPRLGVCASKGALKTFWWGSIIILIIFKDHFKMSVQKKADETKGEEIQMENTRGI